MYVVQELLYKRVAFEFSFYLLGLVTRGGRVRKQMYDFTENLLKIFLNAF